MKGTKEFHRDVDYNHPIESINFILPLTPMYSTTSVKVEAVPFTNQFEELYASVGEVVAFHGALLKHGTEANQTNHTRVSCDFRFAQIDKLTGKTTVSANKKLEVGDYYALLV